MEQAGDTLWRAFRWRRAVVGLCVGGIALLAIGLGQTGQAQTTEPDTLQTRPVGIEQVRERIQEIRRTPTRWRERLGNRLSPDASSVPGTAEEAPARQSASLPTAGGPSRADLRRVERRLQTLIQQLLADQYEGPLPPARVAERFRFVPPDTVRVATPVRDTIAVTDTVQAVPDTVRQTRVDVVERRLLDTGVFRGYEVNFAFGKSTLQSRATRTLDAVGDVVERYPKLRIEIGGHTDSIGTTAFNQQLSEARAGAVRTYLLDRFDIVPGRLVARGYGEAEPVAPNEERSGRALNRRVEFRVLNPSVVE